MDFWIDMAISDYNSENPQHPMLNAEVMHCERIGDAVFEIGEDKKSTLRPLRERLPRGDSSESLRGFHAKRDAIAA